MKVEDTEAAAGPHPLLPPERRAGRRTKTIETELASASTRRAEERTDSGQDEQIEGERLRRRVHLAILFIASLAIVYLTVKVLQPFFPTLSWALAITIVTSPIHARIAARVRKKGVAAAVSTGFVALAIVAPFILIVNRIVGELVRNAQNVIGVIQGPAIQNFLVEHPSADQAYRWANETFAISDSLQRLTQSASSLAQAALTGSIWTLVQFLLVLVTVFYFFRDGDQALSTIRRLLPLSHDECDKVFKRVDDTIHATIYGTVMVAFVQGALAGFMFWILGIPGAVLWGFVMSILAMIPYLGAFAVWGPVALLLAMSGETTKATILAAWGLIAVGLIDNLLYPIFVGKRMRFHTLPVFFFILGGVMFFGASGIVLGPLTLAATDALIRIWHGRFDEEPGAEGAS